MSDSEKRNRFYEETLPEGYREAFVVDAESKDMSKKLQIAVLITDAVLFALIWFAYAKRRFEEVSASFTMPKVVALCAAYIIYIILHELTHGAVYGLLTGHKLTFGFNGSVAYCGVLGVYSYRITSMLSLFAPLTVFIILLTAAFFTASDPFVKVLILALGALHLSGCCGDIYNIWLFLSRFKDPSTLRLDTGPKQIYYTKDESDG